MIIMNNTTNSLAHTKWMCKYHIVFAPKYRRKIIYNQYKESIGEILRQLCGYKGVEIIEGHLMGDHVHMFVSIPPKISVSNFMGYLKGKSALMIFDKHANLKYRFGNRHFWAEGYYVSTVGLNETCSVYTSSHSVGEVHPARGHKNRVNLPYAFNVVTIPIRTSPAAWCENECTPIVHKDIHARMPVLAASSG